MFVLVARLTVKSTLFYSSFPIDIQLFKVSFLLEYIPSFICSAKCFDLIFGPLEMVGRVAGLIETKVTQCDMNLRIL